jgi:hypothetical protein
MFGAGLAFVSQGIVFIGAGEWTRTTDLLITNQLLCQLSYAGAGVAVVSSIAKGWKGNNALRGLKARLQAGVTARCARG